MNKKDGFKIKVSECTIWRLFFLSIVILTLPAPVAAGPVVLYTDILSGPNTGGENNNGIYLSIFGRNFGNDISDVAVTIGGGRSARKMYLGPAQYGRSDIQQLSVQLGADTKTGPVVVTVNGEQSDTDQTFTVRPGNIYFVNNIRGKQAQGKVNNSDKPYRYVQDTWNDYMKPGDFLVMRGTGTDWSDVSRGSFIKTSKGGSTGNPVTLMGYPGEEVWVEMPPGVNMKRFYFENGDHIVLANFGTKRMGMNPTGQGTVLNIGNIDDLRVVNVLISGNQSAGLGNINFKGGVTNAKFLGVKHYWNGRDIKSRLKLPGYYISHSHDIEIAWNDFDKQIWGRGIMLRLSPLHSIKIHDNVFHNIGWNGIVLTKGTGKGIEVYNNIFYDCGVDWKAGLAMAPIQITGVKMSSAEIRIYNNTFYINSGSPAGRSEDIGAFQVPTNNIFRIEIENNIFYSVGNKNYYTQKGGNSSIITASNNLFFGSTQTIHAWEKNYINADPLLVNPAKYDFHLQSKSPAIDAGITINSVSKDHDGISRPQGDKYDIGAYESISSP